MNLNFDRQRKKRRRKITQQNTHPQHKYQNWNSQALLTLRKTNDRILHASTLQKIENCKNFLLSKVRVSLKQHIAWILQRMCSVELHIHTLLIMPFEQWIHMCIEGYTASQTLVLKYPQVGSKITMEWYRK